MPQRVLLQARTLEAARTSCNIRLSDLEISKIERLSAHGSGRDIEERGTGCILGIDVDPLLSCMICPVVAPAPVGRSVGGGSRFGR